LVTLIGLPTTKYKGFWNGTGPLQTIVGRSFTAHQTHSEAKSFYVNACPKKGILWKKLSKLLNSFFMVHCLLQAEAYIAGTLNLELYSSNWSIHSNQSFSGQESTSGHIYIPLCDQFDLIW
jgi:hypothetical protein